MRKQKMRDTIIRQDFREDSENSYSYQLIMREDTRTASYKIPLYSIRVNMTDSNGESSSADVKDLFADAGKAIKFYEKLVRYLATPIDLRYIVEDEMP